MPSTTDIKKGATFIILIVVGLALGLIGVWTLNAGNLLELILYVIVLALLYIGYTRLGLKKK